MRISIKNLYLLPSIFLFTGCVSFQPIPENYTGDLSLIKDTYEDISSTKVYFFELDKIDGRSVSTSSYETRVLNDGRGLLMTPVVTERQVPSSVSTLTIQGLTHYAAPILALKGGNYSVGGNVEVELEANTTYLVKGELSKNYSAIWLEDSSGNVVSKIIENSK